MEQLETKSLFRYTCSHFDCLESVAVNNILVSCDGALLYRFASVLLRSPEC